VVLAHFAPLDMDHKAVAVDVPELQIDHLTGTQTRTVANAQSSPIFDALSRCHHYAPTKLSMLLTISNARGSVRNGMYVLANFAEKVIVFGVARLATALISLND
jgi:hypothetical protein